MSLNRRQFLNQSLATAAAVPSLTTIAQGRGERPKQVDGVEVINPLGRVPIGLIIDDSTCLVNLNRFAMPQFDRAWKGTNTSFHRDWKKWPAEIPDNFVRKFGEWCAEHGVKGKYSVVPYPACVGRLDRELPGWSRREVADSIKLVRDLMMPNWDIHPEMVTHTRVIDLKTGHPYADDSRKFMENWDWTSGRSVDELAAYHTYALQILKNVGFTCEGVTTPGGYGSKVLPQLAKATLQSVRDVFQTEIPHYFRHLYTDNRSVAPRVEYAKGLGGNDPQCVVSVIGCTGDWTGGWDNVEPVGADRFITPDLKSGRMVDVINREEPAMMVCHWTGIHWNGEERGFNVFKEVVRRLHARFDNLIWMKLSELSRYWAAKELTQVSRQGNNVTVKAPFASPMFTVRINAAAKGVEVKTPVASKLSLPKRSQRTALSIDSWYDDNGTTLVSFDMPKGESTITLM